MLDLLWRHIKFAFAFIGIIIVLTLAKILSLCPPIYRPIATTFGKYNNMPLNPEEYIWTFFTWGGVKSLISDAYDEIIHRQAFHGTKAPNTRILALDGKTDCHLLDFEKVGRPLVLNFGSAT